MSLLIEPVHAQYLPGTMAAARPTDEKNIPLRARLCGVELPSQNMGPPANAEGDLPKPVN